MKYIVILFQNFPYIQKVNVRLNVISDKENAVVLRSKKKITCVSANMPEKIRVDRSENLFIFCLIFVR